MEKQQECGVLLVGVCLSVLGAFGCDAASAGPASRDAGANTGAVIGGDAGAVAGGVMVGDAGLGGGALGGDAAVGSGGTGGGVGGSSIDAGPALDAGTGPGGRPDAGAEPGSGNSWDGCDEFALPPDCAIPSGAVLPGELRCTGLYASWQERKLRCGVKPYVPAHELWADGAGKQRYVWLPPGQKVDVSNPDEFDYPIGTRFWKEFYVGPEGNQTLGETRYMLKVAAGWLYTAYVWSRDGTTANQQNDGVDALFGSGHSVPSREQCKSCHIGRQNFILGWDFIMLGEGASGVTARTLAQEGRLNGLDPALLDLKIPGDAVERGALAYLHANCGVSCHNTALDAAGNPSGLNLRLDVGAMGSPQATGAADGINQRPAPNAELVGLPNRMYYDIRPGDPDRSLVFVRMDFRGSETAMPPIGTHVIHQQGVDAVRAWIESMTEARGYPAAAP
jgi:hypothetical protein